MDVFMHGLRVGQLIIRDRSSTFMYDEDWKKEGFPLSPDLPLSMTEHHTHGLFGIFRDSAPDRWGRKLIERRNPGKYLSDKDYLLGVSDLMRLGALRFSTDGGRSFQNIKCNVPSLRSLPRFKYLIDAMMRGEVCDYSELIDSVSLGGARAKVTIADNGQQYLAKIPQINDIHDVEGWEYVCLTLAAQVGIDTASCTLYGDQNSHTLLLKRFDRKKEQRIHYMSAMTLMGLEDGDTSSYIELAVEINDKIGGNCLDELYKRMIFNVLVSNTDDHLRNHGFLYNENSGIWNIAPAFDITISGKEYGANHALRLDNENPDTFETAINIAPYFNLDKSQALSMLNDMVNIVKKNLNGVVFQTRIRDTDLTDFVYMKEARHTLNDVYGFSVENDGYGMSE